MVCCNLLQRSPEWTVNLIVACIELISEVDDSGSVITN
jgi:hypothetical protein